MPSRRERLQAGLLIALMFAASLVLVNPLRDFLSQDDGWAYARSVQHLLASGRYQLDNWAAANMPVQIYIAAGLASIFGESPSLLRLQTLALLAAGLASFYALLRELLLRPFAAAVLCLVLLACPLVLMLGFTFMSDVQFVGWMLPAVWLYVRGLNRDSDRAIFIGSVMAAAAIGTRQFGMAIIAAWIVVWCLSPPPRPRLRRMLAALVLPVLMSVWQLRSGFDEPSFTQAVRLHEQAGFWDKSALFLAREMAWRLATLLQYLGLLMVPLFPLLATLVIGALKRGRTPTASPEGGRHAGRAVAFALLLFLPVVGLWLMGSKMSTRPGATLWLPLWWLLPVPFENAPRLMKVLTLAGLAGALMLILLAIQQAPPLTRWRKLSSAWLLIVALGISLVALHVSYLQLNDTYLVGLLPLALLLPARALVKTAAASRLSLAASALLCGLAIVSLSLWMRGQYDLLEAHWKAAAKLVASGVDPRCIAASRPWAEYHGAFDEWIAQTHPRFERKRSAVSPAGPGSFHEEYWKWIEVRSRGARYLVSSPWNNPSDSWRVADVVDLSNVLLGHEKIVTYERIEAGAGPATCPGAIDRNAMPRGVSPP